jgi:thiol-disulfide isomerase/thioredoxin
MDRLSIVKLISVIAVLFLTSCGKDDTDAQLPPGRVVAVKAKAPVAESMTEFCDLEVKDGSKKLVLPELDTVYSPPKGSARWVNVWATWCKPCIAEMPMLAKWRDKMDGQGIDVSLEFLSVDEDLEALAAFLKANPHLRNNLHLKDPEALAPFLEQLGLDKGAGLPIHIFTDPKGSIRCVRAAAISDTHYPTISGLLKAP